MIFFILNDPISPKKNPLANKEVNKEVWTIHNRPKKLSANRKKNVLYLQIGNDLLFKKISSNKRLLKST